MSIEHDDNENDGDDGVDCDDVIMMIKTLILFDQISRSTHFRLDFFLKISTTSQC